MGPHYNGFTLLGDLLDRSITDFLRMIFFILKTGLPSDFVSLQKFGLTEYIFSLAASSQRHASAGHCLELTKETQEEPRDLTQL